MPGPCLHGPFAQTGRWRSPQEVHYDQGGHLRRGTLVDSVAIHAKAWQEAFAEFGHDISHDELRGQIGKGGDQLLPVFLSEKEIEHEGEKIDAFRAMIIKDRYLPKIKGFPMVRSLFERLRDDGIKIALASSARGGELEAYKKKADIMGLVEEETSSDDAEQSKPRMAIYSKLRLIALPGSTRRTRSRATTRRMTPRRQLR